MVYLCKLQFFFLNYIYNLSYCHDCYNHRFITIDLNNIHLIYKNTYYCYSKEMSFNYYIICIKSF